jgi:hypothetical protein
MVASFFLNYYFPNVRDNLRKQVPVVVVFLVSFSVVYSNLIKTKIDKNTVWGTIFAFLDPEYQDEIRILSVSYALVFRDGWFTITFHI